MLTPEEVKIVEDGTVYLQIIENTSVLLLFVFSLLVGIWVCAAC